MFEAIEAILHVIFYPSLLIGLVCGAIVATALSWIIFGQLMPAPIAVISFISAFGSYAYFEWPKKK